MQSVPSTILITTTTIHFRLLEGSYHTVKMKFLRWTVAESGGSSTASPCNPIYWIDYPIYDFNFIESADIGELYHIYELFTFITNKRLLLTTGYYVMK